MEGAKGVSRADGGNYLYYGVREFGMAAIMNGLCLHGGFKALWRHLPDVLRIRPQCVAHGRADENGAGFVFTHDSIGLGEDGPTHQPVEQTATLRMIPNMDVWRPCDTAETGGLGRIGSSAKPAPSA